MGDAQFFDAVYEVVRAVPRGRVVTYGQVARLLGLTRGARAVGWALRALGGGRSQRVPWHRVLGAGGRVSLGDTPAGHEQRRRLRAEGVRFVGLRVDLRAHGWLEGDAPPPAPARAAQRRSGAPRTSRARRRS